jgi:hypothetical protein
MVSPVAAIKKYLIGMLAFAASISTWVLALFFTFLENLAGFLARFCA